MLDGHDEGTGCGMPSARVAHNLRPSSMFMSRHHCLQHLERLAQSPNLGAKSRLSATNVLLKLLELFGRRPRPLRASPLAAWHIFLRITDEAEHRPTPRCEDAARRTGHRESFTTYERFLIVFSSCSHGGLMSASYGPEKSQTKEDE